MIRVESAFHLPAKKTGPRYLVDAVWPKGIHRGQMRIDGWLKELAPSRELFERFHKEGLVRLETFRRRYFQELDAKRKIWAPLVGKEDITLVYDAKHPKYNPAVFLKRFLEAKKVSGFHWRRRARAVKTPGWRAAPLSGRLASRTARHAGDESKKSRFLVRRELSRAVSKNGG